jgi:transposase
MVCFLRIGLKIIFLLCVLFGVMVILDNVSFYRKKKLSLIAERAGVFLLFLSVFA